MSRFHRIETGAWRATRWPKSLVIDGFGDLVSLPYDAEPMAQLAERNGCPDWAHALRAGWMPRT
ncbi:MAG: hypothetical protein R3E42_16920 [Burkholderiaceae bacterium]